MRLLVASPRLLGALGIYALAVCCDILKLFSRVLPEYLWPVDLYSVAAGSVDDLPRGSHEGIRS